MNFTNHQLAMMSPQLRASQEAKRLSLAFPRDKKFLEASEFSQRFLENSIVRVSLTRDRIKRHNFTSPSGYTREAIFYATLRASKISYDAFCANVGFDILLLPEVEYLLMVAVYLHEPLAKELGVMVNTESTNTHTNLKQQLELNFRALISSKHGTGSVSNKAQTLNKQADLFKSLVFEHQNTYTLRDQQLMSCYNEVKDLIKSYPGV